MKRLPNFRSFRLSFLIAAGILQRNKFKVIFLIVLLITTAIAQVKFLFFYNPNELKLGFIGTYQEYDLPLEVTRLISQGLVTEDSNGRIKANLVSGWEVGNDATSFKFKLKDGLKWADSTEVKSTDLAFAIPNVLLTTPDDRTIQFNLKESYSPLPSLLTKPILKKGTILGTGPYKIEKVEHSRIFITKLELKALDGKLPNLTIRFYPNEKVAITGFNLGEVQALLGFSNSKTFSGNARVVLMQKTDYSKIVSILLQTKDSLLSSRSLRQALAFAAPQIKDEEVANNPYPHQLWAYNPDSKKYLDNSKEAGDAYDRAKTSLSDEKMSQDLILTATSNLEEVGARVLTAWKALGLNVKLRIESGIAQNFQALLITQSIPADPDQYVLWHATQEKTNLTKYDSKRVDKDLEDGRKLIPEEDRKSKYFDFQKTLLEDAPAIFLYFPKYNIAYLKKKEALLNKVLPLMN